VTCFNLPPSKAPVCGLPAQTGSLTPGKEADVVLIDTDSLNLMPMNNPRGVIVECAHAGNVDTVIVAGRIVRRDKRLIGVDLQRMRTRVDTARDALFRRAKVSSDGSWQPRPFSEGADIEDQTFNPTIGVPLNPSGR
jgi:5-methylthioadenosine/S-adenosylhomocysteine deaminase